MGLLESLAGFIDNDGLAEAFAAQHEDPGKARRPLVEGIKRTREQFADRSRQAARGGNRWWQVQNGIVAFTVKMRGGTLALNGSGTNHIPEPMFAQFLDALEQAVNAGELDPILKALQGGKAALPIEAGASARTGEASGGERHPGNDREDWDSLTWAQRQRVSALYREGRNSDGSAIAVVGYQPDAPLSA